MSNKSIGAIAFAIGIVAGLVLRDQLDRPSELRVQQALAALERARDSILALPALNVQTHDTQFVNRVTVVRDRIVDTFRVNDTIVRFTRVVDTAWVGGGDGFDWDFADSTVAYGLRGTCHANLIDPSQSFTTYNLDVYEQSFRPTRWRIYADVGIYAQRPFIGATVRLTDRVLIGPMFGSMPGVEWWDLTWGMRTSIGVF